MKTLLPGALMLATLASTGCLVERSYLDPNQDLGLSSNQATNVNLRNGAIAGDFGPRRGFNGAANNLAGSTDNDIQMSNVNVGIQTENRGAAMVILSISGRTLDTLELGSHDFNNDVNSLQETAIFVNHCSGDSLEAFDYDQPAASGSLTVSEDPSGGRRFDLTTQVPRLDPITGADTGEVEVGVSSFVASPSVAN